MLEIWSGKRMNQMRKDGDGEEEEEEAGERKPKKQHITIQAAYGLL